MREFIKGNGWVQWNKGDQAIIILDEESIAARRADDGGYDATREEFIAAAMQAIEKMRESGITIGTDWLPKWEPKEGQVCWFWDKNSDSPMIGNFERMDDNGRYVRSQNYSWDYCTPFTGELPEPFKSKWEEVMP